MASSRKSGRWGAMSRNSCPVWQKTDRLSARLFVGLGEGIRDTEGRGSVGGAFLQKRFRSRTARHSFDRMSCRPGDPSLERQKRKSPCITECTGFFARQRLPFLRLCHAEYQHLGRQNPQKHRERINGRIADRRHVVAGRLVRVRQRRGIGHRSGEQSHQRIEVQLVEFARDDTYDQQRENRNQEAVADPMVSVLVQHRMDESFSGAESDAGQKQGDADFAEHQVRAHRRIGNQLVVRAEPADQDRYDQRAAGQPELDGLRDAGKRDRDAAQQHAGSAR